MCVTFDTQTPSGSLWTRHVDHRDSRVQLSFGNCFHWCLQTTTLFVRSFATRYSLCRARTTQTQLPCMRSGVMNVQHGIVRALGQDSASRASTTLQKLCLTLLIESYFACVSVAPPTCSGSKKKCLRGCPVTSKACFSSMHASLGLTHSRSASRRRQL
jgi:hypothetical protein